MIPPKELRIGNYFYDESGKIQRIYWFENINKLYCNQKVHPFTEYPENANPIPLTEQWLKDKFHLPRQKSETYYKYSIRNNFEIYCYMDKSGNCLFWIGKEFMVKCDTVHMFQNIYAIFSGKEPDKVGKKIKERWELRSN